MCSTLKLSVPGRLGITNGMVFVRLPPTRSQWLRIYASKLASLTGIGDVSIAAVHSCASVRMQTYVMRSPPSLRSPF